MKKFNRPVAAWQPDDDGVGVPVRTITLPREGHSLEGVYADVAARDSLRNEPYLRRAQRASSDAIRYWILAVSFWVLSLILAVQYAG